MKTRGGIKGNWTRVRSQDRTRFDQRTDMTKKPEDPAVANGNQGRPYAMKDRRDSGTLRILAAQVSKMEELPQAREVTEIQKTSRSTCTTGRTNLRSHSWYRARDEELKLRIDRGKSSGDFTAEEEKVIAGDQAILDKKVFKN
ncbi:hypothetical protein R1sor_023531 [Riccia sorocarpa]|uniref:Uncharacterized protein n=1 Tax=Riccia sorocarpa TaxID=122646 RepID=A0ABD3GR88_9MARC